MFRLALFCALLATMPAGQGVPDWTMGNWEGEWHDSAGEGGKLTAKIIARGGNDYDGVFTVFLDDNNKKTYRLPMRGERDGNDVSFGGKVDRGSDAGGPVEWEAAFTKGECTGSFRGESDGKFTMKRVFHQPPTLGARPPKGAVVLFDGTSLDGWTLVNGGPAPWKLVDGAMQVVRNTKDGKPVRGTIISRRQFGDMKLHIEFMTPFMPTESGQARGNSGVYVQGRYEIQVLDSFGELPRDNEAGGIYKIAVPKVNASLPPGEWQAYDMTFHAPRLDDDGKQVKPAVLTVYYNGSLIHDAIELPTTTAGGVGSDPSLKGPLLLQDHGDSVQYRNIWVLPLDGN